jgi:hypothetical protein
VLVHVCDAGSYNSGLSVLPKFTVARTLPVASSVAVGKAWAAFSDAVLRHRPQFAPTEKETVFEVP